MTRYNIFFSSTYGGGAYSDCGYSSTTSCNVSTGGAGSAGGLANTGVAIVGVVSLACLFIALALAVKFWRRSRPKQPILQENDMANDEADSVDNSDHPTSSS